MSVKMFVYSLIFIFCFTFYSTSDAQSNEQPLRLDNPTELPPNRTPLTQENAQDIELLAMWGLGQVNNSIWLSDHEIAIASTSGTWLYDIHQPNTPYTVIPSLNPQGRSASQFQLSPDGQWLGIYPGVERSSRGKFGYEVWHLPTGTHHNLGKLVPDDTVDYLNNTTTAFIGWLPDNRYVTTHGNVLVLWELSVEEAKVSEVLSHERSQRTPYYIERVAISHDGQSIATTTRADISDQIILQVWDLESSERTILYEDDLLPEIPVWVDDLDFNADDSEVAILVRFRNDPETYKYTKEIRLWSLDGEMLETEEITCYTAFQLLLSYDAIMCREYTNSNNPDDHIVINNIRDNTPLFDPVAFRRTALPSGLYGFDYMLKNTAGTKIGVIYNRNAQTDESITVNNIVIWDMAHEELLKLEVNEAYVQNLAISPDGTQVAVLQQDQTLIIDIATNRVIATIHHSGLETIQALAISPDDNFLISIGRGYYTSEDYFAGIPTTLTIQWDLRTGTYDIIPNMKVALSAAFSPDGTQIAIGGSDGNIYLYPADTLTNPQVLFNDGHVAQVAYSHDGRLLVTANGNYIRFWDTQSLTVVNKIYNSYSRNPLLFTSDDEWLVIAGATYDVEDHGRLVAKLDSDDADKKAAIWDDANQSQTTLNRYLSRSGLRIGNYDHAVYTDDLLIIGGFNDALQLYGIIGDGE